MLNPSFSPRRLHPTAVDEVFPPGVLFRSTPSPAPAGDADDITLERILGGDDAEEWREEDIVYLHWRLLKAIDQLADPMAPLDEKFDILRWVFTEPDQDQRPFSFVSCLRVVGCSPLSPVAYCGEVDAEDIRDRIRYGMKAWLRASLARYPEWVRDAVVHHPGWVEARLAKNAQWLNEQIKRMAVTGDLFA
ncbi:hypothetical protein E6C76_13130 [Pseudothauera nasutitermitis]|uniref:Uncharacterized protein n=1 Tax=Pseudothauera nasutitermitis TaxID=2565930 RepID=A0A4S4AXX5_9RHOO|nr:hypothetical protein [Pseudothauera nasutitermitis]THF64965.1 hypothetical protein E6C76_13130 [Pseudothauera nasutitermitis]